MIQFKKAVLDSDMLTIEKLAATIWTEHYTPIIGSEQVSYMLDKFQSYKAIHHQIQEGAAYYLIVHQQEKVGYFSIVKKDNSLFLSKLYVLKAYRGKGIGNAAVSFIAQLAVDQGCQKISLTVNKYNTNTILAYEKMGFKKVASVINEIGNQFVMDDYVMVKELFTA